MNYIWLSPDEQSLCKAIATKRHSKARENGVYNDKRGPQTDDFTDLNGFGGEFRSEEHTSELQSR